MRVRKEWEVGLTYVIGHQRPDTDAIGAALGFAWYLDAAGEKGVVAARCGQPSARSRFALERFQQAAPRLLTGVAPTFAHAARESAPLAGGRLLAEALARLASGERVIPVVDEDGKPLGVVTPRALARAFGEPGTGAALAAPCRAHVEPAPVLAAIERISDHRSVLLRSESDDFLVTDEDGRYLGLATRGRILDPPRARLFLVDHNELSQAVADADEAEIVGVLDHHRLGNPTTAAPIPFTIEPVGSTSTMVAERCRAAAFRPPDGIAGALLSGILSDTLIYRSPTTTPRDATAADWLAGLLQVDARGFGEELLRAAADLDTRPVDEILDTDRKAYTLGNQALSIAQAEVGSLAALPERKPELMAGLRARREREGLALMALMITDVVEGKSRLLCEGERRILTALPFARVGEGEFDLENIVSRKKQLVPALTAVLEEIA